MTTPRKTPVPNYYPHCLVSFGGRLGAASPNVDSWVCGVRIGRNSAGTAGHGMLNDPQAFANNLQASLKAWFTTAASSVAGSERMAMRSDAYLDWLKVNNIKSDGTYADPTTHRYDYTSAGQGTDAEPGFPTFVTLAISWTTGISRGTAHRGRIYLPLGFTTGAASQINSLQQKQAAGTGKALLTTIAAVQDAGVGVTPTIFAAYPGRTGIAQLGNNITGVSVGNVVDVQRRRKEQIPETYYNVAWP
ncbi:MAG: hypothetical protein ACTHQQ_01295 [Solirubrobacteraceae bacterium]